MSSKITDFNVRDMLTAVCYFPGVDGEEIPWVEHLITIQGPRQDNVTLHFLQCIAMAFEAVKEKRGNWKMMQVLVSASEVRIEEGRKYYEPVQALNVPVFQFLSAALAGAKLPGSKREFSELSATEAGSLILGALFLEEERLHGKFTMGEIVEAAAGNTDGILEKVFNTLLVGKKAAYDNE